jgi:uncharacterized cupin superfamily protein
MPLFEIVDADKITDLDTVETGIVSVRQGLAEHLANHNLARVRSTLTDASIVGKEVMHLLANDGTAITRALQTGDMSSPEIAGYTNRYTSEVDASLHALESAGVVASREDVVFPLFSLIKSDTE